MNHLNNNMTKMVLLVLVAAVVLVALNLNHKKIGKEVALLGTLAVVLVAVFLGNNLMTQSVEEEEEDVVNNVVANVANVANANNVANAAEVANVANNAVVNAANNAVANAANNAVANPNVVNAANYEDDVNVESVVEGFANHNSGNNRGSGNNAAAAAAAAAAANNAAANNNGVESHDMSNSSPQGVNFSNNSANNNNCLPRDVLNPEELLPSSVAPNNWDTPANPGGIDGPNFLNPEHLVGVNTVGQSLRNANRQLRSDPPNPQVKVSPWHQTTIEPDVNRKPLEIGECA